MRPLRQDEGPAPDPAAGRYAVLSAARLTGALFVALGLAVSAGRLTVSPGVGWPLVLGGVALFLLVPRALARRWRSPPESRP